MTNRSSEGLDERRRRLLYRAWHRGMREADLIVGPFADAQIGALSEGDLGLFEKLLDVPSPELVAWVVGTETPPPTQDSTVLRQLCAFHRAKKPE